MPDDKFRKCNALKMFTLCDPIADISQSILTSTKKNSRAKPTGYSKTKNTKLIYLISSSGVGGGGGGLWHIKHQRYLHQCSRLPYMPKSDSTCD